MQTVELNTEVKTSCENSESIKKNRSVYCGYIGGEFDLGIVFSNNERV